MEMEYINIFVYGTLKKGYHNHDYCRDAIRIIPCQIKGTMYDTGYGFPALQLNGNYTIYGQLVTVPKYQLKYFDRLQGVPHLYQRQIINININNKIETAYVYTMKDLPLDAKLVENGNW